MHLSTVGQLAHPVKDGGQRAGRQLDTIVTNVHGLPGREQSMNERYESEVEGGRDARKSLGSL